MTTCPNCGARINDDVEKCTYCGYINIEGAKKKHQKKIDKIQEDIYKLKKEPKKALKRGLTKSIRVILVTVGVLIGLGCIYGVLLWGQLKNRPKMFLSPDEQAFASAYKEEAKVKMEEAYMNKDIVQLAQIFDKAESEDRVDLFGDPHYEVAYASSCYMKLQNCLLNLDKKNLKEKEAEEITYYCFYFYYEAYGDDGKSIFDKIRADEIIPIITDRLGYTVDEMETFRGKVTESNHLVRSKVHNTAKKYYKKYK